TVDDMEGAIRFAVEEGAQVVSIPETDQDLSEATADAVGSGAVVVAPAAIGEDDPNIITVAGTDQNGALIEESADSGDADLTAPGDELEVVGTNLSQTQVTGEAYAAALTAGGVALLRADHPPLQPGEVRQALPAGFLEGLEGPDALQRPAASAHAAGIAQEATHIDEDLVEEEDDVAGVAVWTWFAVVGAVLLFGLL